ncbi:MAG: stalk domain-containing protein [Armatimonadota bacterium]
MQTRVLTRLVTLLVVLASLFMLTPVLAEDGPNFRILQPTGEQSLADQFPIAIAFQSPDDTPIVRFDAYIDSTFVLGGRVKNPIPAGSFQVPCDLTTVTITPGAHKLYVKLTDARGRTTQQVQAVMVGASKVEHVAPTVRIVAPKEGAGISGPSTIRIEASDASGVKWVMLYINGQLRMMMNEPPYIAPWDPIKDKLAAGTYTLRVRAIDNFDNEAVSDPVVVRVVRPAGQTPIETKVPASTFATLGVFEVSNLFQPSGGTDIPRLAFSNVVSPISTWFAGPSLPSPSVFSAERRYAMPIAGGSPLALLPPKALPGQTAAAGGFESRSLPLAPVLAWASYRMPKPGGGSQPVAVPSLLMPFQQPSPRADIEAGPVPFTALLPEKGLPAISEQSLYVVPETPPAQSAPPASTSALPPALPVAEREAPMLVALVPGSMMKLSPTRSTDVTALPAQPLSTERALPQKSTPALSGDAPLPTVKTVSPITPSHGAVLSRPAADIARQANVAGAPELPAEKTVLPAGQARPALMSPTPAASLPAKASPALIASADLPAATRTAPAYTPNPGARAARPSMDASLLPSQPALPAAVMEIHEPYTVQTDDSLEKIARAFSTTPDELIKLNPTLSPERPLPVNATLVVPKAEARIYLDETPLIGAVAPFISNGYTMVPMRNIIEARDGIVIWLPKTQEVNAWADNTFMGLKIGDRHARINAESYLLPVAPSLQQERTMVPLRYLMSALDLHVEYNAASGTYYLVSR